MSSSRVHCSFTGTPARFAIAAASQVKSLYSRRPKPPPQRNWCSVTFAGDMPTTLAALPMPWAGVWVGAHNSNDPSLERRGAVLRFKLSMAHEVIAVEATDAIGRGGKRRVHVALVGGDGALLLGQLFGLGLGLAPTVLRSIRLVPVNDQRPFRLQRGPGTVGDNRHARQKLHGIAVALQHEGVAYARHGA